MTQVTRYSLYPKTVAERPCLVSGHNRPPVQPACQLSQYYSADVVLRDLDGANQDLQELLKRGGWNTQSAGRGQVVVMSVIPGVLASTGVTWHCTYAYGSDHGQRDHHRRGGGGDRAGGVDG